MVNINTQILTALTQGLDLTEVFRTQLQESINHLLEAERTAFVDYDKWDIAGYNPGDSRNGYYNKKFSTVWENSALEFPETVWVSLSNKLCQSQSKPTTS